jgi:hypothetical protein
VSDPKLTFGALFGHLVGECEQLGRDIKPEYLGCDLVDPRGARRHRLLPRRRVALCVPPCFDSTKTVFARENIAGDVYTAMVNAAKATA